MSQQLNEEVKRILDQNAGGVLTNALIIGLAAEMTAIVLNTSAALHRRGHDEGFAAGRESGRIEGAQAAAEAHGMFVAAVPVPVEPPIAMEAEEIPEAIPYRDPAPANA